MEKRQVRMTFSLVGKSHKDFKSALMMDAPEAHECMLEQIQTAFGDRPLYLPPRVLHAAQGSSYPRFFAAGWFYSTDPVTGTDAKGSELVVVGHGDSWESAKHNLLSSMGDCPWDDWARNI